MRTKNTAAILLAVFLSGLSAGCASDIFLPESSSEETADRSADRYDINALKERIEALTDLWTYLNKETEIKEEIQYLLRALDEAYAIRVRAEIDYYLHWDDAALEEFESQTYADYCVVYDMITWAFVHGYRKTGYRKLFQPYVEDEWSDYYLVNSLSRVMGTARADAVKSDDLLNEYYDTAYNTENDQDAVNLECAEIYLDTLLNYDLSEYLYDMYNRDYTAEQAYAAFLAAKETIVPLYIELCGILQADDRIDAIYEDTFQKTDPYEILKEYVPRMSPELAGSADKLFGEQLYYIARGVHCYDGSYTVPLTNEHSALMYTYLTGNFSDLVTVVHEFGHFNVCLHETAPLYLQKNTSDIAEIQSQGLEMLFTQFYPDIYGTDAAFMELNQIYNMLDSVVSGLAVGAFEYEIMQNADDLTPKETAEIFAEYRDSCDLGRELSEISHLYEQPGYFVSYGLSALCALEIYCKMQENPAEAAALYGKICEIPSMSTDEQFVHAIESCGFRNVFDADCMNDIADAISQRIDELT